MSAQGLFVTGTDTGVGKTLVAAALLEALARRGLRVAGMKPIAAGCVRTPAGLRNDDALCLARHANVPADYGEVNPYAFEPPIAPHVAAAAAGVCMDVAFIEHVFAGLAARAERIVVEGVGGWRVPINEHHDVADLARALGLPVLLVVGLRLGCLNHARLTADAIVRSGCRLAGWVASGIDPRMPNVDENLAALVARLPAPHLGTLPHLASPDVTQAVAPIEHVVARLGASGL